MSDRAPFLHVRMQHRLGALSLEVAFALTEPWTVLFGPSGSGKTAVLRAIAGLMRPKAGRIALENSDGPQLLLDTQAGISMPAYKRLVRLSAQSAALFPRMTVRENIAYGAKTQGNGTSAASLVEDALQRFHLEPLAAKYPQALSGGERQRVAVVRAASAAVCLRPTTLGTTLLLLDEPFTGMDMRLRNDLMRELQTWLVQAGVPVLSVTHDVGEAFQLQAEVIKIADGRVLRQGPAADVLQEERLRVFEQLRAEAAASQAL